MHFRHLENVCFEVLTEISRIKSSLSKYLSERIRSFFPLTIQNMRHAQTLVRECFAFSARPVPLNLIFVNFQMESSYVLTSTSRMLVLSLDNRVFWNDFIQNYSNRQNRESACFTRTKLMRTIYFCWQCFLGKLKFIRIQQMFNI